MFESSKCKADLPYRSEADSHQHDRVNFFDSKVANATTLIKQSSFVDVGEGSGIDLVVTRHGAEVFECLCGDGIWQIECCPQKSSNCCSVLQKDT